MLVFFHSSVCTLLAPCVRKLYSVVCSDVTRGGKGVTFTLAPIHYGGVELLREPRKGSSNVTSTSFNTVNFLSKELRVHHVSPNFDHGGAGATTGAPNLFFLPRALSNLVTPLVVW